ncbi:MAG TPA: hypothetical protein VFY26_20030, partial [Anaerolineales bacterium]|nr:hypothetical protein [Anaerolineales bacterium]
AGLFSNFCRPISIGSGDDCSISSIPEQSVSLKSGLRVILVQFKGCSFPVKPIPFLEYAYGSFPGAICAGELIVTLLGTPVEDLLAELKPLYRLSHK